MNTEAKRAAFNLAFGEPRSPLPYEQHTDEELLPGVHEHAPSASRDECLEAVAAVRVFIDLVYKTCDAFRDGEFGLGDAARGKAMCSLLARSGDFTEPDCERAFAAGLLWTAF